MACVRCAGFVQRDRYRGLEGELHFLRCLNCGAISEPRMDGQRGRPTLAKRKEPRTPCGSPRASNNVAYAS